MQNPTLQTREVTKDPFQDLRLLAQHMLGGLPNDNSDVVTSQWSPRVDIREEPTRFVILADLPGIEPKDIEIHMDKGILTIRGERTVEERAENGRFTRSERVHGTFHRRFALPDSADAEGIQASGKHGVLEVVIPKRPETTPRRIEVSH